MSQYTALLNAMLQGRKPIVRGVAKNTAQKGLRKAYKLHCAEAKANGITLPKKVCSVVEQPDGTLLLELRDPSYHFSSKLEIVEYDENATANATDDDDW